VLAHPTIIVLELVRRVLVYEDVDKDLAARLEPSGHFREQVRIPLHVLEHFDREHMREPEQRAIDSWI
jgi:transposase